MQNCSGDITQLLRKSFWLLSQVGKQHKEQAVVFQSCGSHKPKTQRALPCELRQSCACAAPGPVSASLPLCLTTTPCSSAVLCAGGCVGLSLGQQELGVSEVCGTPGSTLMFPASDLPGGAGCFVHKDFRLPVLVLALSCFPSP